tara:strand:- start:233 stop:478 length:246 start_codon:yes stop_codon:yes gene_type:complete
MENATNLKTREKIHIQNTTFEEEYGYVIEWKEKTVIIELTVITSKESIIKRMNGLKFKRSFSRKTGLSNANSLGRVLKILP